MARNPHIVQGGKRARRGTARAVSLRALDHHSVAVHFVANGKELLVRGRGIFGLDARMGGVLRIDCPDASGGFELLICERDWKGQIQPGKSFGCDYLVNLAPPENIVS